MREWSTSHHHQSAECWMGVVSGSRHLVGVLRASVWNEKCRVGVSLRVASKSGKRATTSAYNSQGCRAELWLPLVRQQISTVGFLPRQRGARSTGFGPVPRVGYEPVRPKAPGRSLESRGRSRLCHCMMIIMMMDARGHKVTRLLSVEWSTTP